MPDYTSWQEKYVAVTTLQLDPKNPRIPGGEKMEQRELIAELVEHENIDELAKDISANGYSPLENLIAMEDDGKVLVLEGNRRLAALKLLIAPELAPDQALKRFRSMANAAAHSVHKVRVVFAPSRPDAAPLIMQKHTRRTVARWSTLQQARYYRSLVAGGMSPRDVAKKYGGTAAEVLDALRTNALYEIACALDLPSDLRAKVHDSRNFPATSLTRIFNVPEARQALGIEYMDDGDVRGTIHQDEFLKAFARIVSDIAKGEHGSRTLNTVEQIVEYVGSLGRDAPDRKRKGSFTPADIVADGPEEGSKSSGAKSGPARTARPPRVSPSIIPIGVKCTVADERVRDIFAELKRTNLEGPKRAPNTSAVMTRILLELAVGHYLVRTGKMKAIVEARRAREAKRQRTLPREWHPTLREMLQAMVDDPGGPLQSNALKAARRVLARDAAGLSLEDLNAFVHSVYSVPTPRELRGFWKAFEEVFLLVLREPDKT